MSPPGDRREPPAYTKCPPAAQRKQARSALVNYKTQSVLYVISVYQSMSKFAMETTGISSWLH